MRVGRSLAGRLLIWFVIVQSALSVLALGVTLFLWRQPGDEYAFAQMNVSRLLVEALAEQPGGGLAIGDTDDLRAFQAARPDVRLAVLKDGQVLAGSSSELAGALRAAGTPDFANATFTLTQGPLAGSSIAATAVGSRWGQVVVVSADNALRPSDLPALVLYMSSYLVTVMVIVMLGAALIVPLVIRRALRPLQEASKQAARIDLRSRDLRLPEGSGVPSELAPLVRSINVALDRLDEGFERQQRFAAEAAHELRTPLAILAARIDSQADQAGAEGMRRDLARMRTLVDQLLLIARLERRGARLEEAVDLVALARDVVADCTPLAIASGRELALTPQVDRLVTHGERQVLESALLNLVQNAIRAEPPGGAVEILVAAPAEIRVIDHGAGVSEADRSSIFDPFWRRDERHPGAGLGLTIVKEAAAAHGGSIGVEPTPGGGATFRLRLAQTMREPSLPQ